MRYALSIAFALLAGLASAAPEARFEGEGRHMWSGEKARERLTRAGRAGAGRVFWKTMMESAVVERGEVEGDEIAFRAPHVSRRIRMDLIVRETGKDEKPRPLAHEVLWVYPGESGLPWEAMAGRRIGMIGDAAPVAAFLRDKGAKVEVFATAAAAARFRGNLLIVATRETSGVLSRLPVGVPAVVFVLAGAGDACSRARIVASGHAVFDRLDATDLSGWRGAARMGAAPGLALPAGAFRRLLAGESGNGSVGGMLVAERFRPDGRKALFCALPVIDVWGREPVCETVLWALMHAALSPPHAPRRSGPLAFRSGATDARTMADLARWLSGASPSAVGRLDVPAGDASAMVIDASGDSFSALGDSEARWRKALQAFLTDGGIVLVLGTDVASVAAFRWVLGKEARLGKAQVASPVVADVAEEWLSGILPEDLSVLSGAGRSLLPDGEAKGIKVLVRPGLVVMARCGCGCMVFVQAPPSRFDRESARIVLGQILTNCGAVWPVASPRT